MKFFESQLTVQVGTPGSLQEFDRNSVMQINDQGCAAFQLVLGTDFSQSLK